MDDYSHFSPDAYLAEYYAQLSEENKFLLRFYHDAYARVGDRERMLDVGGGPTIYQLISASAFVSRIVFSDFLEINRATVKTWIAKRTHAFKWDDYFDFVARLETRNRNAPDPAELESRLRNRIAEIIHCDLKNKNPLDPAECGPFDIVSSSFCIECIRNDVATEGGGSIGSCNGEGMPGLQSRRKLLSRVPCG